MFFAFWLPSPTTIFQRFHKNVNIEKHMCLFFPSFLQFSTILPWFLLLKFWWKESLVKPIYQLTTPFGINDYIFGNKFWIIIRLPRKHLLSMWASYYYFFLLFSSLSIQVVPFEKQKALILILFNPIRPWGIFSSPLEFFPIFQ